MWIIWVLYENGFRTEAVIVCGRVPWLYQYWPGGFMLFVVLMFRNSRGLKAQPAPVPF